jgi:hypothetical protein
VAARFSSAIMAGKSATAAARIKNVTSDSSTENGKLKTKNRF